jgi:predicted phage terminase large subunit-like protein
MLLRSLAAQLADTLADGGWRAKARPSQLPPPGDWNGWALIAGRGFGKTFVGSSWTNELAATVGRIALIGSTAADARDVMVEGDSGILRTAPSWSRPVYEPSKRRVEWPNGATATLFSAEEADRLRGPQHSFAWADELAAWGNARDVWDMLMFGLRLGRHPRWLVTTTPKPIKLLKELIARPDVVVTGGSTFENAANLAPTFLQAITDRYAGTRLGRQELEAELLSDTPGALWSLDLLDRLRVTHAPELRRIVVSIDPAVSESEGSDETGIIVAGVGAADGHVYVLADLTGKFAPHEWAGIAIAAYRRHLADRIVAEKNQGGAMVEGTIRAVDPNVPYRAVHASRGKVTRAEPVSALYEQGKVHHVGVFSALEDQMCAFTSDFNRRTAGYSPDRVDALVWAITELVPPVAVAGAGVFELYRQQAEAERPTLDPETTETTYAVGSVEHARQQGSGECQSSIA